MPHRNTVLVILDIVGGVIAGIVGLSVGIGAVATFLKLLGILVPTNAGALSATIYISIGLIVLAWALSSGFFLIRLIRKRYGFLWPVIGLAVIIAVYYAGIIIASNFVQKLVENQ